jgi:hypothetical protein
MLPLMLSHRRVVQDMSDSLEHRYKRGLLFSINKAHRPHLIPDVSRSYWILSYVAGAIIRML